MYNQAYLCQKNASSNKIKALRYSNQKTDIKKERFEISLICLTYNSPFESVKKTLVSFLNQKEISFEIIVADDGSDDNHKHEIEELFGKYGFRDFKLVMNQVNRGTVQNHLSGLETAEGEYFKALGAGDYLFDDYTVRNWVDFLNNSDLYWSFSEAVYYDQNDGKPVRSIAHPQILKPYIKNNPQMMRWNYIVHGDIALGAAVLCRTHIAKKYCSRIAEKGVKYAEDNMWRLMMFDGIVAAYYEKPTLLYEYGSGISTGYYDIWSDRITNDFDKTNEIMRESICLDKFQMRMLKCIGNNRNLITKIMTRGKLWFMFITTIKPRMTLIK